MQTLDWLDLSARCPLKLTLHGRRIYRAKLDDQDVTPSILRGHVLLNINKDIISIPHWIIFEDDETNDICIAPVREHLLKDVMEDPSMFEQPIDLRSVYDMLSI